MIDGSIEVFSDGAFDASIVGKAVGECDSGKEVSVVIGFIDGAADA